MSESGDIWANSHVNLPQMPASHFHTMSTVLFFAKFKVKSMIPDPRSLRGGFWRKMFRCFSSKKCFWFYNDLSPDNPLISPKLYTCNAICAMEDSLSWPLVYKQVYYITRYWRNQWYGRISKEQQIKTTFAFFLNFSQTTPCDQNDS